MDSQEKNKMKSKKIWENTLNNLFSFRFSKRLLIFFFGALISVPLASYLLTIDSIIFTPDNWIFDVLYLIFIAILFFCVYLLIKNKYRLGFWEYTLGTFIAALYYFTSIPDKLFPSIEPIWIYTQVYEPFTYLDIPFYILLFVLMASFVYRIILFIRKFIETKRNNTFLEDNPITHEDLTEDTTYNHLISKLKPALFEDVYKSSFSVGVIGPWGTGKSSFLKAVEYVVCDASIEKLKENFGIDIDKKPDTIFIEFSPFLNHNEEQVIHEFFTQLSNKLSERSGRLSNLITIYSEKLANIAEKNPWFSLFKFARNSRENRSAKELYDEIQVCIRDLNLKIVVTVDDLDRLNAKEILQVLKLIRNTSNFPNMVFLVALDKEYVMNALKGEKEYMKERYLEKFFQLEVSVSYPNIDSVLNFMINEIYWKLKDHPSSGGIFTLTTQELIRQKSFLADYLITHRDVKRFINQFYYDYKILNLGKYLDIDFHDLVYMTLLKIFCPNMMNLTLRRSYHLVNNEGYFVGFKTEKDLTPKHEIKGIEDALNYDGVELNKQNNSTEKELIINGSPASLYEVKLLMKVFGLDANYEENADSIPLNSITRYKTLRLYKHHILSEGELKESDYKNITLRPYSDFKSKLNEISDDDTFLKIADRQFRERTKFISDYPDKYFRLLEIYFSVSEPSTEILSYLSQITSELSSVTSDRFNFMEKIKEYFLERLKNKVYINHTVHLFRDLIFKSFNSNYIDNFSKIIESINKSYLTELIDKIELMSFYNYLIFLKTMKESPLTISNLLSDFEESIGKMNFNDLIQVVLIYTNERRFEIRYQPIMIELLESVKNINNIIKTHKQFDEKKHQDLNRLLNLLKTTNNQKDNPVFFNLKGFDLNNEINFNQNEVKTVNC
jgi:predicted KAP-like P-loop ATPase